MNSNESISDRVSHANTWIQDKLSDRWTVERIDSSVRIQADNSPFWFRLEPLQDTSILITAYRRLTIRSHDAAPYMVYWREFDELSDALRWTVLNSQAEPSRSHSRIPNPVTLVPFTDITTLLAEHDITFAAISEPHLARNLCRLLYHNTEEEHTGAVSKSLLRIDAVSINGVPMPFEADSIFHHDCHTHRRIPLRSDGRCYGLGTVTLDDGIEDVTTFVANDATPTPPPTETVPIRTAIEDLIDAGADGIAVQPIQDTETEITLRAWLHPEDGFDTIRDYNHVTINGEEYDIDWRFDRFTIEKLDIWVPIYSDDAITGLPPTTLDEGLKTLHTQA